MIFELVKQGLRQGASYHEPSLGVSLKNGVLIRAILCFWFADGNITILNDPRVDIEWTSRTFQTYPSSRDNLLQ